MDDMEKRIEQAVLEGFRTGKPTLAPLVEEAVKDAIAGYEAAERELAEREQQLNEFIMPGDSEESESGTDDQ